MSYCKVTEPCVGFVGGAAYVMSGSSESHTRIRATTVDAFAFGAFMLFLRREGVLALLCTRRTSESNKEIEVVSVPEVCSYLESVAGAQRGPNSEVRLTRGIEAVGDRSWRQPVQHADKYGRVTLTRGDTASERCAREIVINAVGCISMALRVRSKASDSPLQSRVYGSYFTQRFETDISVCAGVDPLWEVHPGKLEAQPLPLRSSRKRKHPPPPGAHRPSPSRTPVPFAVPIPPRMLATAFSDPLVKASTLSARALVGHLEAQGVEKQTTYENTDSMKDVVGDAQQSSPPQQPETKVAPNPRTTTITQCAVACATERPLPECKPSTSRAPLPRPFTMTLPHLFNTSPSPKLLRRMHESVSFGHLLALLRVG
ncbi:hypothetical protein PENSPDRAFT_704670 [Peniophora sp. CONT]|nr:hypothetical protein PENSPDRAFT_704670 [Peniophora sp. CONT]